METVANRYKTSHDKLQVFGLLISVFGLLCIFSACTKIDYTQVQEPAYLRVFNDFNYSLNMAEKDAKVPFLCMLVNPEFDAAGKPVGAEIVGDFLDVREPYAPPYPSHIGGSTSVNNPEYPGKENVLVGPILNGYDLSSWAQIPAGKLRFLFLYRPKNTVPYFQLENELKGDVMIDTTLQLEGREVYTLHLLQKDFDKKTNGALLRTENFHKQPFSDSLVYVNFYNYSAKGFWQADGSLKPVNPLMGLFQDGIRDQMDVYLTLYPNEQEATEDASYRTRPVPGYTGKYLTTLNRDSESDGTAPYVSFPLWANRADDGIHTSSWQYFDFFVPGMTPSNNPFNFPVEMHTASNWAAINCLMNGKVRASGTGAYLPNMIVNIHSGIYNPRSFATVNTIEVINGAVYLTTVQRKYPAPVY